VPVDNDWQTLRFSSVRCFTNPNSFKFATEMTVGSRRLSILFGKTAIKALSLKKTQQSHCLLMAYMNCFSICLAVSIHLDIANEQELAVSKQANIQSHVDSETGDGVNIPVISFDLKFIGGLR
jgi:hypothetical protein